MRCPTRSVSRARMAKVAGILRPFGLALLLILVVQLAAVYTDFYQIFPPAERLKRGEADPNIAPGLRKLTPMAGRFVQFSAYRESPTTFYVIGLYARTPRIAGDPVHGCRWQSGNGTHLVLDPRAAGLNTTAVVHYIKHDEHNVPYAIAVVKCEFPEAVGSDGQGGLLSLTVPTFTFKRALSRLGRLLWRFNGMETLLSLREERDAKFGAIATQQPPYKYAFCGPPIAGKGIRESWIVEWLTYHLYIMKGDAHFFFYNVGGLSEQGRRLLEPFVQAGFVTITDVLDEGMYPSWYQGQVLYINDCLHRTRFVSHWTFFFDFDEVLYFQAPLTLGGLLEKHANASFMSLGSWPVSTDMCRTPSNDDEWLLEQMLYKREEGPECRGSASRWMCPENSGRRKFILNPLKVFTAGVHSLVQPEKQDMMLDASSVRLDHYRGVLSARSVCGYRIQDTTTAPKVYRRLFWRYLRDDTISVLVHKARRFIPSLLAPEERSLA